MKQCFYSLTLFPFLDFGYLNEHLAGNLAGCAIAVRVVFAEAGGFGAVVVVGATVVTLAVTGATTGALAGMSCMNSSATKIVSCRGSIRRN